MIVDGQNPGVLYFTTIPRERIAIYRAAPEDVLSRVKLSNESMEVVYGAFPILKNTVCEITLQEFCKALNKASKDDFPTLKINEGSRSILMEIPDKENPGQKKDVVVGTLLAGYEPGYYADVLKNFHTYSSNVIRRKFNVTGVKDITNNVSIELVEIPGQDAKPVGVGLPLKDGYSLVSFNEYVRKRKIDHPNYELEFQFDSEGATSRTAVHYVDDWLEAESIMPGLLWFMTRLQI